VRKFDLRFFALVVIATMLVIGLRSESNAAAWLSMIGVSGDHDTSGLIVRARCIKVGGERICLDDDDNGGDPKVTKQKNNKKGQPEQPEGKGKDQPEPPTKAETAKRGVWICCSADGAKCLTAYNEANARSRMGNASDLRCYIDASGP
jgi:hypothetical protein